MKRKSKELKHKVSWPDLRQSQRSWSDAEIRGVCINPIATGIGCHPRSISDEDWVLSCENVVRDDGLPQFLTNLLHILRITIPQYLGEPPAIGDYPQRGVKGDIPLPDVAHPGDRGWEENWNEEMVGGILCNPVYAGIPPFEAVIDDEMWIAVGVRLVQQIGLRQYLGNVLYELKKSLASVSFEE